MQAAPTWPHKAQQQAGDATSVLVHPHAKKRRVSPSPVLSPLPARPRPAAVAVGGRPPVATRQLLSADVNTAQHKHQEQQRWQQAQQWEQQQQEDQQQQEQQQQQLPWSTDSLAAYLHGCLSGLATLFPSCSALGELRVDEMALVLFRQSYFARPCAERVALALDRPRVHATLTAALTVAIKFAAHQALAPAASSMQRITRLPASLLVDAEWSLLASLQWRLLPAAQEAGVAAPVQAAEEEQEEEQEEQGQDDECASWEQQRPCEPTADELTAGVLAALAQLKVPAQPQPQPQPQDAGLLAAILQTQPHALGMRRAARAASLHNLVAAGEAGQPEAAVQPALLLPAARVLDWGGPVAGGLFWASCEEEQGQVQGDAEASPPCLAGLLEALCTEQELE